MRVLFLSPVPPWPPRSGGRIRSYELLRALHGEAAIDLWAVGDGGDERAARSALEEVCASARFFARSPAPRWARLARARPERWFHSVELARALADERALAPFDLVHADEPCLLRALPAALLVPLVVHHHKLDVELAIALGAPPWERAKLARLEMLAARRARHHIVCSALDAERLRARHGELAIHVVESGVDPVYFAPTDLAREPGRLLFLGNLAYEPNVDALEVLVRSILPRVRAARPDARLRVVGERPDARARALAGPGVEIVGVLDDVRDELARASLLVAPLRIGGGTRLKLVTALAMGCPVVASPAGAEGLALEDGEHLSVADEPDAFARAVLALLADPSRAAELARRGRERVLERYTWSTLAGKLRAAWETAIAGELAGTAAPARLSGARRRP